MINGAPIASTATFCSASENTGCQTLNGHLVCNAFKNYWNQYGLAGGDHLGLFGFPTTDPFTYTNAQGHQYTAQYFERARFELHCEDPNQTVKGGLLGDELKLGIRN